MPIEMFSVEKELPLLSRVAYVFPGQNSQTVGMAQDLYDTIPGSRNVIDTAKGVIGEGLVNLMFDGPDDELSRTENAQPLILTASIANLVGYLDQNPLLRERLPALVFGHSLGELTALVTAGVLSFEDGVQIAQIRGEIMASAPKGKMVVVSNIPQDELAFVLNTFPIDIGVINNNQQIVLSGEEKAMDEALAYMKGKTIKARPLRISIASHSRVMEAVQGKFAEALRPFAFHDPRIPIISVFQQKKLNNGLNIRDAFVSQMTDTLHFPRMLSAARQSGVDTFVEFGPEGPSIDGIVTGNIRALDPSVTAFNIRDLSTMRDNPFSF